MEAEQQGRLTPIVFPSVLLVVDVQNDFCEKGAIPVPGGDDVVPYINGVTTKLDGLNLPVIYTQDWHKPETKHFEVNGGIWPVHCVQDTEGADFHPDLRLGKHSLFAKKGQALDYDGYSALDATDECGCVFRESLTTFSHCTFYVVGLATDYCILHTVLDLRKLGLQTVVLKNGIRAVEETSGKAALKNMEMAGAVMLSMS